MIALIYPSVRVDEQINVVYPDNGYDSLLKETGLLSPQKTWRNFKWPLLC